MSVSMCNKCGKVLNVEYPTGSQKIEIKFGYSSTLFDGETWKFELCDACLDEFATSFKHSPKGFMEDHYAEYGEMLLSALNNVD